LWLIKVVEWFRISQFVFLNFLLAQLVMSWHNWMNQQVDCRRRATSCGAAQRR
jgi:hypothetical protein